MVSRLVKNRGVVVVYDPHQEAVLLRRHDNGRVETLYGGTAREWLDFQTTSEEGFSDVDVQASLLRGRFIRWDDPVLPVSENIYDSERPQIKKRSLKVVRESSDLIVLFNTEAMSATNPILALNPYGSLCWRLIETGVAVRTIRERAVMEFGYDCVVPLIGRLKKLGFLSTREIKWEPVHEGCRDQTELHPPTVQARIPRSAVPWYCLWEITKKCDLRCNICYLDEFADRGMSLDKAEKTVDSILEFGVPYVCLLGGEPTLRRDLPKHVRRLREAGVYVKTISNGQRSSHRSLRSLQEAGINQIEFSFDGLSAEMHERSRGEGSFKLAAEAVKESRALGIPRVGMVLTVHEQNLHQVDSLYSFMESLGVTECYISIFKKTGIYGGQSSFDPLSVSGKRVLEERVQGLREDHPEITIATPGDCSCGRTSLVIGASGSVRLCTFSTHQIGDVTQRPLRGIWQSLPMLPVTAGPLGYCSATAMSKSLVSIGTDDG